MTNNIDEKKLVERCLANDRRAQEAFYRRFFPTMMRMVRRYTNDEDAIISIINNGLLRAFKKLDTFSFQGSLEGWVRRLVFNALSDYFRKKKDPVHFMEIVEWDQPTSSEALSNLYFEDLIGLADRLPKATRDVFFLYCIEGFNHKEIGAKLGISDGTSKWHLAAARKRLKLLINQQANAKQQYAG